MRALFFCVFLYAQLHGIIVEESLIEVFIIVKRHE